MAVADENNCNYLGFSPLENWEVDEISPEISGLEFFDNFVKERKPVKFNQIFSEFDREQWNFENLKKIAGDEKVCVEVSEEGKYGLGNKVNMTFTEFLTHIENGETKYYLTTQAIEEDESGPIALSGPPVRKCENLFPKEPKLLGNLQPYQFNIWLGRNKDESSSGLHHDFHDNLYVLIKGQKQFCIYPPSCALQMPTKGKVKRVLQNGLILYHDDFRSDGAHLWDIARWKEEEDMEKMREKNESEEEVENSGFGFWGAEGGEDGEEDQEDKALEALLLSGFGADGEDNFIDDFDEIGEEDLASDSIQRGLDQLMGTVEEVGLSENKKRNVEEIDDLKKPEAKKQKCNDGQDDKTNDIPDNFCTQMPPENISPYMVTIKAGEMLYLPAGWFHEVISQTAEDNYHFAFNYWLHPPPINSNFEQPYEDDFWKIKTNKLKQKTTSEKGDFNFEPHTPNSQSFSVPQIRSYDYRKR